MLERVFHRAIPSAIVPVNPEHAHTLDRADAMLDDPAIKRILHKRDVDLRASAARANRRLAGR
jgi:hypothetical protein